jgi:hypothetical protein
VLLAMYKDKEASDVRLRQGHGQQPSSSTGERVRNIVALLRSRTLGQGSRRLGELELRLFLYVRHDVVTMRCDAMRCDARGVGVAGHGGSGYIRR